MSGQWMKLALSAAIVTLPFRLRIAWVSRVIPPLYYEYTDFSLYLSDVFLLLTVLLWAVPAFRRREPLHFGPRVIVVPLAGLTLAAGLSVVFSADPGLSLVHFLRLALLDGLYLAVVNCTPSLRSLVIPFSISILLQAVVGILQSVRQASVGLFRLGEIAVDVGASGASIVTGPAGDFLRAYGLTDHPNILGGMLALGLLVVAGGVMVQKVSGRMMLAAGAVLGIGLAGLLLTFSRSGWAAFLGSGFILGIWTLFRFRDSLSTRHMGVLIAAGLTASLLSFHALPWIVARAGIPLSAESASPILSTPDEGLPHPNTAVLDRLRLVDSAWTLFLDHPLTGVGLGAFPIALQNRFPEYPQNYSHVHVVVLAAAAETGVFAGVFMLWLTFAPVVVLLKNRKMAVPVGLATATAGLAALSMIGLLDHYPWSLASGSGMLWLFWGLWAAYSIERANSQL